MPYAPALRPRDHAGAVALFRAEVIGALTRRELDRGELVAALRALSAQPFRPPGASTTRRLAPSTLERWYYAYRAGGLAALRPRASVGGRAFSASLPAVRSAAPAAIQLAAPDAIRLAASTRIR